MAKISVCVCTYKRNNLLSDLLLSLLNQKVDFKFNIIVVDNSDNFEARALIDDFNKNHECNIYYENEARQGISYARNRCVAIANRLESDYVAFIDDDETASPDWLSGLVRTAIETGCDVVLGPVISVFPDGSKKYLINSSVFKRKEFADRSRISSEEGRAGNVLIKSKWLSINEPFKIIFSKTGSEDYQFFNAIGKKGASFCWSAAAVVSEIVPVSRQRIGWILERRLRSGINYWRINYPCYSYFHRLKIGVVGLCMIIPLSVFSIVVFPFSKVLFVNVSMKLMNMLSRVLAFTKMKIAGY